MESSPIAGCTTPSESPLSLFLPVVAIEECCCRSDRDDLVFLIKREAKKKVLQDNSCS